MDQFEKEVSNCLTGNDDLSRLATDFISKLLTENEKVLTEGFDDEQIFQQIEYLYTTPILDVFDEFEELEIESDEEESEDETPENNKALEEDDKDLKTVDFGDDEEMGFEQDDGDSEDDRMAEQALQKGFKGSFDKTEIDDNFFSLREMEKFCDEEDEKEMNGEELELDEELVDQLYGEGDDEEDEEDDKEDDLIPKAINHDDFFKSKFEKRTEKVAQELEELEEDAIEAKPWHLLGETTADKREKDELLGMDLDFHASTAAVAPTVEMTEFLEAMIIQRIRDAAYDDVERKTREMVEPADAKRRLVPDEERKSLSQLYEDEFLQTGKDLDEDADRKKIKEDMSKLFAQLDFLTYDTVVNQKEVEIKVISDAPALQSEERGLSLLSAFSSLAPEEVSGKSRGQFMDKSERSATDIKRDRRRVKSKIKAKKAAGKEVTFKKPKNKPEGDLRPIDGVKVKWANSAKVFKTLQDEQENGTLTAKAKSKAKKLKISEMRKAKSFKL